MARSPGTAPAGEAAGVVLPPPTGIAEWLAVAAALGLTLIQVGGIAVHLPRGEARRAR